jgi:4-hydroxy-3-polyprenylbenzoate decarboxylase
MVHGATPLPFHGEADFVISGTIDPRRMLPEGPFGDHLGYYAKVHDFPVMEVERVYARQDAIWPFTVVGRPPQEDTIFGEVIHELTGPAITTVLPGIKAVHAVDAAGVHPLLLAIGTERYVPYEARRKPRELHTQAHAILGQGQLSLAKYLWITTEQEDAKLDIHDVGRFLQFMLERVDWSEDLHFTTHTTIDTLDYSGTGLNEGSKVFIAAAGPCRRKLPRDVPAGFQLPSGLDVSKVKIALPGILVVEGPAHHGANDSAPAEKLRADYVPLRDRDDFLERFCAAIQPDHAINQFPIVVIVNDADFATGNLSNFVWVTFTRSNPAHDINGIASFTKYKHWGCRGSLVIDARSKPWHSPELEEDEAVTRRIESLAANGGPLTGLF